MRPTRSNGPSKRFETQGRDDMLEAARRYTFLAHKTYERKLANGYVPCDEGVVRFWRREKIPLMKSKHASIERPDVPSRKRVFIVEDHPVFRQGLVQMVNAQRGLSVCGQAKDAEQAFEEIGRLRPDIALVDISLPGKSGLELIKELRSVNRTIKLLVVSMHDEALYANRVLQAGGDGYIMKQEDLDEIIHAIRDVLAGRIYVSEEVMAGKSKDRVIPPVTEARSLDQLTDSELEFLELLGKGKSQPEIARQLGLSASAVQASYSQIKRKLNLKTPTDLLRYAVCWVETGTV